MKKMWLAVLVVMVMMNLSLVAFATETETTTVKGMIKAIDVVKQTITIVNAEKVEFTYTIDKTANIKLADLKIDQEVTLTVVDKMVTKLELCVAKPAETKKVETK